MIECIILEIHLMCSMPTMNRFGPLPDLNDEQQVIALKNKLRKMFE